MGPEEHGGHCELEFDGLEIPVENVLLGEGLGMRVTQTRLAIARLTHCMRWLGMARRALEIALPHVRARRAFGQPLADKESVQGLLGEAALQIEIGRLLTMRAAFELDQGRRAQAQVSMAKIQVAEALHRAVDTAIQLLGAKGYSKDTPLEWMYRYARQARLVDGASEVHRMVVARNLLEHGRGLLRMALSGDALARWLAAETVPPRSPLSISRCSAAAPSRRIGRSTSPALAVRSTAGTNWCCARMRPRG